MNAITVFLRRITLRGKILIYRILNGLLLGLMILSIYFVPIFSVRWSENIFGNSEIEYYSNVSIHDTVTYNDVQVNLKEPDDIKEVLDLSQEDLNELMGKKNVKKDFCGYEYDIEFKPTLFIASYGIVALIIILVFMLGRKRQEPKLVLLLSNIEKEIAEAGGLRNLDRKKKEKDFPFLFGLNLGWWTESIFFAFAFCFSLLISYFNFGSEIVEPYSYGLSINCLYPIAVFAVLEICSNVYKAKLVKEIEDSGIMTKREIISMPYLAPSDNSCKYDDKAINSRDEYRKMDALREYKKLLDEGVITEEEFNQKKNELL